MTSLYNRDVPKAEYVTRDLQGKKNKYVNHHRIKIEADSGEKYLIHNTPRSGPVITDAKHMSSKWNVKDTINIGSTKTVGDIMKHAGSTYFKSNSMNYGVSGTCIGSAYNMNKFLKKR